MWLGLIGAYLFYTFVGGSLAYKLRARADRLAGRQPPPYLKYIFIPKGAPKFKGEIPKFKEARKSLHMLVGIAALLTGAFLVFCGVALAFDAEWSRILHPLVAAEFCLAVSGIGAAFLYLAWRLLTYRRLPNNAA